MKLIAVLSLLFALGRFTVPGHPLTGWPLMLSDAPRRRP